MTLRPLVESRVLRVLLCGAVLLPVTALRGVPVSAQTATTASITGIVTDVSGKPLGGASITVSGPNTSRSLRSGPDGRFTVALPPGTYDVTASSNGFQSTRSDDLIATAGQSVTVKLALANATLQTIGRTSRSRSTSINTTTAAQTFVSSQTFLDQGQGQVANVLDQIPGVEINRDSSNAPGANTSISIRGAQPYESQILIDGHPVVTSANSASGFNATFINSLLLGDVEVNKGPGNLPNTIEDAVGGTLNFKTPTITGGPTLDAFAGYDSFNGTQYAFRASDTFGGKLGVLIGIAENKTPGYLAPQTVYGGAAYPYPIAPGTAYEPRVGVLNFGYRATQNFQSNSQLAKVSYNFSPQTSLLFTQYSTQTNNDETGTNYQYIDAKILPCIDTPPAGFTGTPNCTEAGGKDPNYTSTPNLGLIGRTVPINLYAPYPDTTEFDNEPIYSGEFRTVIGPGSLLARYYTGAINRIITQTFAPQAVIPCISPACPNGDNLNASPPFYNAYQGEPYIEDTIDVLHGFDAQYSVPLRGNGNVTLGFDRHTDTATFGEYDPTEGPPPFTQGLDIQSLAYSLRGNFRLTPKLTLEAGNYLSNTTYVGTRFDPHYGLVYRVNPDAAVRASYGSAYVAPYYGIVNAAATLSQGTLTLATGPFKPETSSGYDLGTDFNVGRNSLVSFDGYLTNIFNRYASVTTPASGVFENKPYTMETQNGNQAVVREQGLELSFLRAPRIGLGFHSAIDLLRDYAYNQDPNVSVNSIFSATSADNVQLPTYPYSKIRNDLFYSFGDSSQARFSATSYGANNAFGQPGFTEFDGSIRLPVKNALVLNIGATNIFNHDGYQAGGVYNGGYTFPALGGGSSYTSFFFVQPRTLFIQLQRSVGPGGESSLSRTSL